MFYGNFAATDRVPGGTKRCRIYKVIKSLMKSRTVSH